MLTRLRRFARASLRGGLACFLSFPILFFLWRQAAIAARSLHLTNSPYFELAAPLTAGLASAALALFEFRRSYHHDYRRGN